ncbi:MAG: hypothetical protein ACE5I5_14120 [Candidatus Heimdallarchaeota archaeon]
MEKAELTPRMQVALASLVGIMAASLVAMGVEASTAPQEAAELWMPIDGAIAVLALFFIPLLWWRHPAGYIGAVGLGLFVLIMLAIVIGGIFIIGEIPISILPIIVVDLAFSVLAIIFSFGAYRERSKA